jgi:hypothetical protein
MVSDFISLSSLAKVRSDAEVIKANRDEGEEASRRYLDSQNLLIFIGHLWSTIGSN